MSRTVGDAEAVRTVFDAQQPMVVALAGPELTVVAATAAYRAYTGRSEMIGMPIRQVFPEALGQHVFDILDDVRATAEPAFLKDLRVQIDRPDRVEIFLDVSVRPHRSPDGEVAMLIVEMVDQTEQVRARRAAQQRAVEAEQRYAQARDVIHALQVELLPSGVPVLPRVQVAASYLLADVDTAAGGDWFDAIALPDGRLGLVAGDVVGHGVTASAVMGQLRILIQERLAATGDIAAAVAATDRMAARVPGALAATMCVAVLDPASGELGYCTAGHPPPLVLPRDGDGRYLPASGAGPLGIDPDQEPVAIRRDRLAPGDMVVLYTDGILERPGRTVAQSTVELAQVATNVAADRALRGDAGTAAERVCTQSLELLTRATGHADDITLLVAQLVEPPPDFALTTGLTSGVLATVRHELAAWLGAAGASDDDVSVLLHAVNELAANALEHAYVDSTGPPQVTINATLHRDGRVTAKVRDHGRWRDHEPSPGRGLGLTLATNLADTVVIDHDEHGTRATVRHRLSRPARMVTDYQLIPRPDADPLLMLEQPWADGPRIRVDGAVDAESAPAFEVQLVTATASGTRSLTVDLTGVTLLASIGVAALHRVAALSAANRANLRLYAPPGSTAHLIMETVRLPHLTADPDE
ncbi:SpoIIE family protein phosphatase [Asanoa hainanensis]|uniref:SpoIIE family protein phosphatase n=1 Tax=Asanoa hainanensis TaxID=560556 RepID=UPI001FE9EB36|nr:SpoIIE family protein phosphatase [Asanoa hainanensis]